MIRRLLGGVVERVEGCSQSNQVVDVIEGLSLYHYFACPYCFKVRGAMRRLNIRVELCDVDADKKLRELLLERGGTCQVPCLYIATEQPPRWLYESDDIIAYLQQLTADLTSSTLPNLPSSSDQ